MNEVTGLAGFADFFRNPTRQRTDGDDQRQCRDSNRSDKHF